MPRPGSHLRDQWIGTLALFLVLSGGTAYAVTQIDRNSVFSKHIVNGEVMTGDLANGAVSEAKLAAALRTRIDELEGTVASQGTKTYAA